jgi:hypothetical protein
MGNPWDRWSPYWWQTVAASRAFRPQPHEGWIESGSSWTPPAAPSGSNSGILAQLTQPPAKSAAEPFTEPTGLFGRFLTGAGRAQATQNRTQTETGPEVGNYVTPVQSRSSNMAHCLDRYVHCHDLHSFGMLINGKRCQDCYNMCLLSGNWPEGYCPLRPF